jgi:hypothetical protein
MSLGPERVAGQGVLPDPVHGTLSSSLITRPGRGEGGEEAGLTGQVEYSAFESGDRRFAWVHSPVTIAGEGGQFFFLELSRSGDEWDVLDVDAYDSPEDALQAAGRAWLKENGGPEVPSEPVADW